MRFLHARRWRSGIPWVLIVFGIVVSGPATADWPGVEFAKQWGPGDVRQSVDPHYRNGCRVITNGQGDPDFITSPVALASPFQGVMRLDIRLNRLAHLSGVEFRLGDARFENYYAFPIPYYTDPLFNIVQDDHWQSFTFGPSHARLVGTPPKGTLNTLGVYIQDNARGALIVDIANLRWDRPVLDRGIVSLTFDDGYDDHYWAAGLMHQYGLRGTAYVMPRQIGQPGYLTLQQLKQMQTDYGWGVSAHHQIPLTDFAPAQLDRELRFTVDFLRRQGFTASAPHIAYPLGRQNRAAVVATTRRYFQTARLAGGGAETFPPANRYFIRAYNVHRALAPEAVLRDLQKAVDAGQWMVLMFHYLVEEPQNDYDYSRSAFEEIVKGIAEDQFVVMPVHEAAAPLLQSPPS